VDYQCFVALGFGVAKRAARPVTQFPCVLESKASNFCYESGVCTIRMFSCVKRTTRRENDFGPEVGASGPLNRLVQGGPLKGASPSSQCQRRYVFRLASSTRFIGNYLFRSVNNQPLRTGAPFPAQGL
jgi:hypothetical protein